MLQPDSDPEPADVVDISVERLGLASPGDGAETRAVPVKMPVAIEVSGISYAVMMATPADLSDYAIGFCLSEGLVTSAAEVKSIHAHPVEGGIVLRLSLPAAARERVLARARVRVTESSCGLCGIDNIAQVLRPLPPLAATLAVPRKAIARALDDLRDHQPLGRATGAVHAAAFADVTGKILVAREDVGRHNALDKLVGALSRAGLDPATGFILLTARCSYELVEKTVRLGCPVLVTISAPTSLAADRARAAGLTLVALARRDFATVVSGYDNVGG